MCITGEKEHRKTLKQENNTLYLATHTQIWLYNTRNEDKRPKNAAHY